MMGISLALLAALVYGLSVVLVRKRLDESNVISIALVLTAIGNVIIWPLALMFANFRTVDLEGVLFFVIAGALSPGMARLLYFKGMDVIGVSVNAAINGTYPMYTSLLAVLLLGEVLTLENWIGMLCIVVGVIFVQRSSSNLKTGPKRIFKKGLIFPILSCLVNASSQIVRKYALNIYNEPLLGVAIGYFSSLILILLLSVFSRATQSAIPSGKDFRLFWKSGIGLSLGWLSVFYALSQERVSIVVPLIQTEPLFVLFFSYMYLKKMEHVSFELIINTFLIVTGIVLITIR